MVYGLRFTVQGNEIMINIKGLVLRIQGLGFRVYGSEVRIQGLGFQD